jgi:hypothetical protein
MLWNNIFCLFGGRVFQQTFGIRMGTIFAPLLADWFLWSYEVDFILLQKNENKLARSFNFTFRYIDDVLSLNNSRFGDFVDRIYPIELEIKDTTDTGRSAWCDKSWMRNGPGSATSGTYPWSFVTQIFHSGQPSHGGDCKTFEVMTST